MPMLVAVALGAAGCKSGGGLGAPDGPVYPDGGEAPKVECREQGQIDIFAPVAGPLAVPGDLGRLLACEHRGSRSAADISAIDQYKRHGWQATTGIEQYAIQYVTQGPGGTPRRVSALLYLPSGGKPPYPIVAVNHGTNGLGPNCGPTHQSIATDYMALPLAGRGYAVIAADYPGMGVDEGVYSYGIGEAEGYSILDGVRALGALRDRRFDAAQLGDGFFVMGHSQGGQANLFAHQLYHPSLGRRLLGSLTLAPGLGDLRGFNYIIGTGSQPISGAALFMILILHSETTYRGGPAPSAWLSDDAAAALPKILHDQCFADLYKTVPARWPTQSALFAPGFLYGASTCSFYTPCPAFQPWEEYLRAELPGQFVSPVPALIIQGDKDNVVPPSTTACVANRLKGAGTPVQTCGYAASDHYNIVDDSMDDMIRWMEGRVGGTTPSVCPAPLTANCP